MMNPMYDDAERGIPEFLNVWEYLNGSLPIDEQMARTYTEEIYRTETIEPAWNHMAVQEGIPDLFQKMSESRIPLLFIQGSEDNLVQNAENVKILSQQIETVDFRIIEGAGHMFFNREVWDLILGEAVDHLPK